MVKPTSIEQRYESGDEIHVGDRVRYAGDTGTIVFVIDRGEYSPEFGKSTVRPVLVWRIEGQLPIDAVVEILEEG